MAVGDSNPADKRLNEAQVFTRLGVVSGRPCHQLKIPVSFVALLGLNLKVFKMMA